MYVCLVGEGARLATSDAKGIALWDLKGDAPTKIAEVVQEGQLPFFTGSPAGERMTAAAGVVARSYTALGSKTHWVRQHTHVGIYRATDLSEVAQLDLAVRLDHQTLALSPDGSTLVSTLRGEGPIAFDAKAGAEVWRVDGSIGSGASWSPGSNLVAAGSTDQGPGELFLVHVADRTKQTLPRPSSKAPLYDSPFRSVFSTDGSWVVFSCQAWGAAGVTAYDTATASERWAAEPRVVANEEAEFWDAPELDLAFDDALVLAGQHGRVVAYQSADGTELSELEFDPPDAFYFAADSVRRCIWVTRAGQPTAIPMPSDWR
jgi:hypothetical protein